MNLKYLPLLVYSLCTRRSFDLVLKFGLTYSQVAELLGMAIMLGYVEPTESGLKVSDDGFKYSICNLQKKYPVDKDEWIRPEFESRTSKVGKYEIFLPNFRKLKLE